MTIVTKNKITFQFLCILIKKRLEKETVLLSDCFDNCIVDFFLHIADVVYIYNFFHPIT